MQQHARRLTDHNTLHYNETRLLLHQFMQPINCILQLSDLIS